MDQAEAREDGNTGEDVAEDGLNLAERKTPVVAAGENIKKGGPKKGGTDAEVVFVKEGIVM